MLMNLFNELPTLGSPKATVTIIHGAEALPQYLDKLKSEPTSPHVAHSMFSPKEKEAFALLVYGNACLLIRSVRDEHMVCDIQFDKAAPAALIAPLGAKVRDLSLEKAKMLTQSSGYDYQDLDPEIHPIQSLDDAKVAIARGVERMTAAKTHQPQFDSRHEI